MAQELIMPDLGMDMQEALLINWTKAVGDVIKQGDIIAEVETDKTTVEVASPLGGKIMEFKFQPGENLQIGAVIGFVGVEGESAPVAPVAVVSTPAAQASAPVAPVSTSNGASTTDDGRFRISPVARKVAEERGIDIAQVSGTGPHGRIVKADVENFVAPAPAVATPVIAPTSVAQSVPVASGIPSQTTYGKLPVGDHVEIQDISKLRAKIAERMVLSKQQVPHFYITAEVNLDALSALRNQLNATIEDKAKRISVNDMLVKALALSVRQFPNFNTHFYGDKFVIHRQVNVGIAVALENGGLINVVAKDADKIAIGALAAHNREMIGRARDGKVKPEDVAGSTVTISNLGMFDVDNFVAIVNPPESLILAVGSAKSVPVVAVDGTLGVGTRMKITISVDHRVANGAEAGEFMAYLKNLLENPMRLLM